MFTGIIDTVGIVKKILSEGSNISLWVESSISHTLQPNQSLAHNGVCLTIEEAVKKQEHKVTLVKETIEKTTFKHIRQNDSVNLEPCLKIGDRLDGHFVQGHVDSVAKLKSIEINQGSYLMTFELTTPQFQNLMVEKGSVAVNGISLTCFNVQAQQFSVAIIPHTYKLTTMNTLKPHDEVNIEFDILGKYILKKTARQSVP